MTGNTEMPIETHAQAIADKLLEHAGRIENFDKVVWYLSEPLRTHDDLLLDNIPTYVLGAVRAAGWFLNVPKDVHLSDDLLPAIAEILRDDDE